jgi:hypothetical protein
LNCPTKGKKKNRLVLKNVLEERSGLDHTQEKMFWKREVETGSHKKMFEKREREANWKVLASETQGFELKSTTKCAPSAFLIGPITAPSRPEVENVNPASRQEGIGLVLFVGKEDDSHTT